MTHQYSLYKYSALVLVSVALVQGHFFVSR